MSGESKFKHRSWRNWAMETARKIGECFEGDARCIERTQVPPSGAKIGPDSARCIETTQEPPSGAKSSPDSTRVNRMSLTVLGVTRVKSYCPRVSHLVLDVECRPK